MVAGVIVADAVEVLVFLAIQESRDGVVTRPLCHNPNR